MSNQSTDSEESSSTFRQRSRSILFALLFPTMAIVLNGSMFGIALPTIRDDFGIQADVAAWLSIAFSLPFMMFMPLYGRLGDELGKARLLTIGMLVFTAGSIMAWSADSLLFIFLGRIIQGAGSASVTPLSIAILVQRFDEGKRGRALATWNSIAPGTSIFGPLLGGFLVDSVGWRTIFVPATLVGFSAFLIVAWFIPSLRGKPNWNILRTFDWGGVFLLSGSIISLVLWVSSRPVTGVAPLQDWRILLMTLLFGTGFVVWERRQERPLVDLRIFRGRSFNLASVAAAMRMSMQVGISFVLPLYLTDIYDLTASAIGFVAMSHSISLFVSIRIGGVLADRYPNRWVIALSLLGQLTMMTTFSQLPTDLSIFVLGLVVVGHGSSAGMALASMHRTALGEIASDQAGAAAGVYSMTRFAGSMLSTALAGVILQTGLDLGMATLDAYQMVFGFLAILGFLGVLLAVQLRT